MKSEIRSEGLGAPPLWGLAPHPAGHLHHHLRSQRGLPQVLQLLRSPERALQLQLPVHQQLPL